MRLVTRGDLDGLVSAVLITTMEQVKEVELVHPQEITDGKFEVRENDILSNLPYHPACAMWFDHHELTESNRKPPEIFRGKHALMPSVARVVFDYYQTEKLSRYEPLVAETDRFDSAQLSVQDISDPQGTILLGFTIDPRTGFGIRNGFVREVDRTAQDRGRGRGAEDAPNCTAVSPLQGKRFDDHAGAPGQFPDRRQRDHH